MGYLKITYEAPTVCKTLEDLLCLAVGVRKIPQTTWWDLNEDDHEFIVMGITAKEGEKLVKYIYEKIPDYAKKYLRFKLVGYDTNSFPKPRDSWEALNFMLQSFPKRRKL